MRTRADVGAEAMNAPRVTDGGTGVMLIQSHTSREAMRLQARIAPRNGSAIDGATGRMR